MSNIRQFHYEPHADPHTWHREDLEGMAECGELSRRKFELQERSGLTPREAQVALCLSEGLSYAEIADDLCVSYHTVCSHVKVILQKTGAGSSRKLAAIVNRGWPS